MEAKRIINGTNGELWLDGEQVAEISGFQAKINITKETINLCGQLAEDTKIVGYAGKGSVKMYKVNSRMAIKISDYLKQGRDIRFTIISKLRDPDSYGAERVVIKNVSLDDLTLADWEAKKSGTIESPFTFTDYEYLDMIEVR